MELKHFTLEGANATLPLVKSIMADVSTSWKRIKAIDTEINKMLCSTLGGEEVDTDIAEKLNEEAGDCYDKFTNGIKEVNDLGVLVLDMENFAVGFTSVINEKVQVYVFRFEEDSKIKFYRNIEANGELTPIEELKVNEKI